MKIMVMSDLESDYLWDHYTPEQLEGIELIIACGDLHPHYLSFVETFSKAPLLYVHGNHDERYATVPPEGCYSIEDRIYVHNGLRILGLGGSMRYSPGEHQYTEKEMKKRVRKLALKLRRSGGFDILVTHAPMFDFHDGKDMCHMGFEVFRELIDKYSPKYFVHGHVHMNYSRKYPRLSTYNDTVVINAYRTYTFDYDALYEKTMSESIE